MQHVIPGRQTGSTNRTNRSRSRPFTLSQLNVDDELEEDREWDLIFVGVFRARLRSLVSKRQQGPQMFSRMQKHSILWVFYILFLWQVVAIPEETLKDSCDATSYIPRILEPKWPLFWLEKGLVLRGLTFKHRGCWGSRYRKDAWNVLFFDVNLVFFNLQLRLADDSLATCPASNQSYSYYTPWKLTWQAGQSPCLIGDTSHGYFSILIVILVFGPVIWSNSQGLPVMKPHLGIHRKRPALRIQRCFRNIPNRPSRLHRHRCVRRSQAIYSKIREKKWQKKVTPWGESLIS